MGIAELIKVVKESNVGVIVNIEGAEAVKVSIDGDNVNVDILNPAAVSKILAGLK